MLRKLFNVHADEINEISSNNDKEYIKFTFKEKFSEDDLLKMSSNTDLIEYVITYFNDFIVLNTSNTFIKNIDVSNINTKTKTLEIVSYNTDNTNIENHSTYPEYVYETKVRNLYFNGGVIEFSFGHNILNPVDNDYKISIVIHMHTNSLIQDIKDVIDKSIKRKSK